MMAIEARWSEKQAQVIADEQKLAERRQEFEVQIKAIVDRMKIVTSETVIKHLEEEVLDIEKQIAGLTNTANKPEQDVDMHVVLQYARYLVEHLSDIMLHLRNPLRKAAFFGALFDQPPKYDDLVGGTQEKAQIPGVNGLFQIAFQTDTLMVTLSQPIYKSVITEIMRWNDVIGNIGV